MTDQELIKQWDEYIESMGSVMGKVEHMAQQMRDRIEELVKERDKFREVFHTSSILLGETELQLEEAEVKLAKAVKTIRFYTEYEDLGRKAYDTLEELGEDVG